MSSGEGSKGSSSGSESRQVDIPDFLQSFLGQGADTAGSALSGVSDLAGQDLVADFDPLQTAGQNAAVGVAGGAGGFIPEAQDQTLQTAEGRSLESFLDPTSFSGLTDFAGNSDLASILPPEALQALTDTASGSFLTGGEGFNAALEAANRDALRKSANAFGGTAGGVGSGLSRAAVGEQASDAFSRLFQGERTNQLNAAGKLGAFKDSAANRALSASGILGNLSNAERGRQDNAVANLPGVGLLPSDILRGIGGERQDQSQAELSGPFQQQLQLLKAALAGLPIESLLGESGTRNSEFEQFGLGFG